MIKPYQNSTNKQSSNDSLLYWEGWFVIFLTSSLITNQTPHFKQKYILLYHLHKKTSKGKSLFVWLGKLPF